MDTLVVTLFVVALLIYWSKSFIRKVYKYNKLKLPSIPESHPILGLLPLLLFDTLEGK
jgi:hypothetical protein